MDQLSLLCSRDTGWITISSCLGTVHYWARGAHSRHAGRLVQFHYNDRKSNSEHIPYRKGSVASFLFQFGTEHGVFYRRMLNDSPFFNVHNVEDKIHFKTIQQLSKQVILRLWDPWTTEPFHQILVPESFGA